MRITRRTGLSKGRSQEGREPKVHTEERTCPSILEAALFLEEGVDISRSQSQKVQTSWILESHSS